MVSGVELRAIPIKNIVSKDLKCKTRREFLERYRSHYEKALRIGIADKVCKHMKHIVVQRERKLYKRIDRYLATIDGLTVLYKQYYWVEYKSKPDYVIEFKGMVFVLEVKSEKYRSNITPMKMHRQQLKYDYLGVCIFPNFKSTVFCSDTGFSLIHYSDIKQVLESFDY